jgi:hypothetical protein
MGFELEICCDYIMFAVSSRQNVSPYSASCTVPDNNTHSGESET